MRSYDRPQLLTLLRGMAQTGRPCPVILLLGPEEIPIAQIKAASPLTKVILRVWRESDGGPDITPAQFFDSYIQPNPDRRLADYYQINNEWNDFSGNNIAWWRQAMVYAESRGYKLAVLNFAVGNPGDDPLTFWLRNDVLDLLRYARDHQHVVNLHQYDLGDINTCTWTEQYDIQRFERMVYPFLPSDLRNNMPLVVHSEFGQQKLRDVSATNMLAKMRNAQEWDAQYPWLLGGCIWSIGDTGSEWTPDNWANKMQLLAQI